MFSLKGYADVLTKTTLQEILFSERVTQGKMKRPKKIIRSNDVVFSWKDNPVQKMALTLRHYYVLLHPPISKVFMKWSEMIQYAKNMENADRVTKVNKAR